MAQLGLALSGGGARGIAHLGVLAALDELQLPVGQLAGVSSGAIAAVFYAAGFAPREILKMLLSTNLFRLTRPAFSRFGLLHLDAVAELIARQLGAKINFEDLNRPLTLVATDLMAGESVYFSSGPVLQPLLASSAVPIVYRPVEYQGRQLVDGGLLNNLPIEPLLGQEDIRVVGVNCNPINSEAHIPNFRRLIERTLHLAINANTNSRKTQCHLLLEPPELRHYRPLSYKQGAELFDIGYRYTLDKAESLQALLSPEKR
ncbi:patatin-like phospholipase family protein [Hymenobacter sp. BT683]|uniref:Patatin-like phospholipase family protein n=1 Tax=Hymenobacter jeongseonensis TaxID=2791027 RepID=A0ABS0IMF6_9BACT|nr:patatin-like phospholipase family protein [Hymenobacter jeongseonensis]MBF9239552.1 patatin-like phospholipase family protein [Hymenobacter jeongseonensis]